ncbi:MAG: NGG1p interacting factor NIF3, partial [Clostridia bacterium]|nr:NGG1p interacting factor NIF3 [Clostridia bacterium]
MRLKEIYKLAIRMGKIADPRGEEEVENVLKKARKEYDELKEEKRKRFDTERLSNPYSDTRILHGNPELNVKSVLAGIDLEVSEVLLADRLREKGKRIDLLVSHHPEGKALAALHEVMHLQEDVWYRLGVPINIAESLMKDRIMEVERTLAPVNHNRAVDAARLLDMAFMCVHTPADNLVTKYLSMYLDEKKPATVGDLMEN